MGSDTCLSSSATLRISASGLPAAVAALEDRLDDYLNCQIGKELDRDGGIGSNPRIVSYGSLEVIIGSSLDPVNPFGIFHSIEF